MNAVLKFGFQSVLYNNTALYNTAKKYAQEKNELQAETDVYRNQVSA